MDEVKLLMNRPFKNLSFDEVRLTINHYLVLFGVIVI